MDTRRAAGGGNEVHRRRTDSEAPRAYAAGAVPIIIDTYNALHVTGVLPPELAVGEPEALAQLIAASRFGSEAVWLICDGVPRGASRVGRIVIEGAGPGKSADDHIAAFLDRSSAPRRLTVVTSDRAIQRRARSRGADWIKSEEFLAMLAEDARRARPSRGRPAPPSPRRSVPLNDREVAGWMTLFEITAEQAAIEGATPLPKRSRQDRHAAPARRRTRTDDAALERYLEATKDLPDPLAILDGKAGGPLLAALGEIDDAALERLMQEHEPPVLKDGARIGGRKRVKDARRDGGRKRDTQ
ncbi:MAG: hypothetical protein RLY21_2621 [Planctomycetota bacterium]|jgi:hypothetical protein